jgi:hypothetical protein
LGTILRTQPDTSWEDANCLIHVLHDWGIHYLVVDDVAQNAALCPQGQSMSAIELLQRLARCSYPRVRDACIALFLLHPELTPTILTALKISTEDVKEQLATLVLATLYLQRLWSVRLALAFGHPSTFPEAPFAALWLSRHLPPPCYHDGAWGLYMLEIAEQQRSGLALNYRADWQNQIDHLLLQVEAEHPLTQLSPSTFFDDTHSCQEEPAMSMRPNVNKQRIEQFLRNLARSYHKPGRIYLVGGAALVHAGVRTDATQDIDLTINAADEDTLSEAIRQLKDSMRINVEFASPADFMPLPPQWEMHTRYIGRYGSLDVFYFDFYSIALSKIQRGSTRDINDVRLLLQQGYIDLQGLDEAYQAVLPLVGKRPYNRLDPRQFATRYAMIRQLL